MSWTTANYAAGTYDEVAVRCLLRPKLY